MRSLFSLDNPIIRFLSRAAELMALNLLFIISCLPLFTIGSACAAMYTVLFQIIRDEDPAIFRTYWKAFKRNFKPSLILWLPLAAVVIVLGVNCRILQEMSGGMVDALKILVAVALALCLFVFVYLFPMLALFENTAKGYFANALIFSISHLPTTLGVCLIHLFPVIVVMVIASAVIPMFVLMAGVGFAALAYASALMLYKLFKPHLPAEMAEIEDEWEKRVLEGEK